MLRAVPVMLVVSCFVHGEYNANGKEKQSVGIQPATAGDSKYEKQYDETSYKAPRRTLTTVEGQSLEGSYPIRLCCHRWQPLIVRAIPSLRVGEARTGRCEFAGLRKARLVRLHAWHDPSHIGKIGRSRPVIERGILRIGIALLRISRSRGHNPLSKALVEGAREATSCGCPRP